MKAAVRKKVTIKLIEENLGHIWYCRDGSHAVPCWIAPISAQQALRVKGYIVRKDKKTNKTWYQDWSWDIRGRCEAFEESPEDLVNPNSKVKVF